VRFRLNRFGWLSRNGDGAFAERMAAADAEVFVEFAGGKDEEETLADRLRFTAFGAVEFAGRECAELFPHGCGGLSS
jgi:hypothetical protein